MHRRDQLEREIITCLPGSPWVTQVGRLRCLRGIDTLTAAGPAAPAPHPAATRKRAKRRTIIAVAAARELAGFCWAVTTRTE